MQTHGWDDIKVIPYCDDDNKEYFRLELERLSGTGLGPWEVSILEAIWYDYGQVPDKQILAQQAFGIHLEQFPDKAAAAVEKCFAENWIQFLTPSFLDQKLQELVDGGYLMPNGLIGQYYLADQSPIGLISYTERGAALIHRWNNWDSEATGRHWCLVGDTNDFTASYGVTLDACEYPIDESVQQVLERESAVEIGRWCDRWWNRFERGFQIRFRARYESNEEWGS